MAFFDNTWVLVGITSSGHGGCATPGYAGLYTRVSFFVSFIQNIINNEGITVRSTLRTTQLTTASTQKMNNKAGKQTNFLNGSITFFIVWLLIMINS
jgi:secreted trypsin-like serine protease